MHRTTHPGDLSPVLCWDSLCSFCSLSVLHHVAYSTSSYWCFQSFTTTVELQWIKKEEEEEQGEEEEEEKNFKIATVEY